MNQRRFDLDAARSSIALVVRATAWLSDAIAQQAAWLPGLTGTHLLQGSGHWAQQERPDQVNDLILHWLHHPTG